MLFTFFLCLCEGTELNFISHGFTMFNFWQISWKFWVKLVKFVTNIGETFDWGLLKLLHSFFFWNFLRVNDRSRQKTDLSLHLRKYWFHKIYVFGKQCVCMTTYASLLFLILFKPSFSMLDESKKNKNWICWCCNQKNLFLLCFFINWSYVNMYMTLNGVFETLFLSYKKIRTLLVKLYFWNFSWNFLKFVKVSNILGNIQGLLLEIQLYEI